jgi:hypothetical protein
MKYALLNEMVYGKAFRTSGYSPNAAKGKVSTATTGPQVTAPGGETGRKHSGLVWDISLCRAAR